MRGPTALLAICALLAGAMSPVLGQQLPRVPGPFNPNLPVTPPPPAGAHFVPRSPSETPVGGDEPSPAQVSGAVFPGEDRHLRAEEELMWQAREVLRSQLTGLNPDGTPVDPRHLPGGEPLVQSFVRRAQRMGLMGGPGIGTLPPTESPDQRRAVDAGPRSVPLAAHVLGRAGGAEVQGLEAPDQRISRTDGEVTRVAVHGPEARGGTRGGLEVRGPGIPDPRPRLSGWSPGAAILILIGAVGTLALGVALSLLVSGLRRPSNG